MLGTLYIINSLIKFIPVVFVISIVAGPQLSYALGNHPEADTCPLDKPYYSICTHSLHNLEGWYGQCQATRETAQLDADQHANEFHSSNSRWTGVLKAKGKKY